MTPHFDHILCAALDAETAFEEGRRDGDFALLHIDDLQATVRALRAATNLVDDTEFDGQRHHVPSSSWEDLAAALRGEDADPEDGGIRALCADVSIALTQAAARIQVLEREKAERDAVRTLRRKTIVLLAGIPEPWKSVIVDLEGERKALEAENGRMREAMKQIAGGHQPPESIGVHWAPAYRGLQQIAATALAPGGQP